MKEYLEGHRTNGLLQSVLHDLKVPEYVAGCKALGLISRLITQPLWSILDDEKVSILDMNCYYASLVDFLQKIQEDIGSFMTGQLLPFGEDTILHKDAIFDILIATSEEYDDKVETILLVIIPAFHQLSLRLFKDHLPGGKWDNFTEDMQRKTAGTVKHNQFSESIFGYLDNLLRL